MNTVLQELVLPSCQVQEIKVYEIIEVERLGIAVIYNIDCMNRRALINIFMKDWKNRIHARKAAMLLLKIAFDEMNLQRVEFCFLNGCSENQGIKALYNTQVESMHGNFENNQKYQVVLVMSVLRHEYEWCFQNEDRVKQWTIE